MKTFYQYLAESVKEYKYRVKTIVPLDDGALKRMETCLAKYDLVSFAKPKKTIVQNHPLDFKNVSQAEVVIVDFVLRMPVTSYALLQEIRKLLGINENQIVVRGENEPVELEAQKIIADLEAAKEDKPAMLDDATYSEYDAEKEVAYGDEYNKKLLNYLAQIAADRDEALAVEQTEPVKALFGWLKPNTEVADDFNKDHDTVKPVHRATKKAGKKADEPNKADVHGNYTTAKLKK